MSLKHKSKGELGLVQAWFNAVSSCLCCWRTLLNNEQGRIRVAIPLAASVESKKAVFENLVSAKLLTLASSNVPRSRSRSTFIKGQPHAPLFLSSSSPLHTAFQLHTTHFGYLFSFTPQLISP